MSRRFSYLVPQLAIVVYAVWSCRFVFLETYGPLDSYGNWATLLWLAPLVVWRQYIGSGSALLSLLGLLALITGDIGGLNTFRYAGMALTFGALLPVSSVWALWILCSVSWMPSLVVILNMAHLTFLITPVRFALAALPLVAIAVLQPKLRMQQ